MQTVGYTVHPRLPKPIAQELAIKLVEKSVLELRDNSDTRHNDAVYAPTGNRVQKRELEKLQTMVRDCAEIHGYPYGDSTGTDRARDFDAECAVLLHQNMSLQPTEAAHIEMWAFMTCILLPDVVRWRYSRETIAPERFIGSNRGLRRNTFGRLWWRAYLLYQKDLANPYELIPQLNEDDYAALMERASIAENPILVTAAARSFLAAANANPEIGRREIVREGAKRIRRLISLVAFEAIGEHTVQNAMDDVFAITVEALRMR